MFLFTTSTTPRATGPTDSVVDAVRQGAERTGTDFNYLLKTAQRESALDPAAKASTSSATGLFQFVDQTWLGLIKSDGAKAGLASYADAITARADGSYAVPDAATREAILDLRKDPGVAALMAGTLTQQNRDVLAASLGREPSAGDLYAAHVLGARGASDLIRAAAAHPDRAAAADFPEAAAANRSIFYDRRGRPRGAADVYAALAAGQGASTGSAVATPSVPPAHVAANGPALYGLFQTEGRAGPISEAVAKIWRVNNSVGSRAQTAAISYFPRVQSAVEPSSVAAAGGSAQTDAGAASGVPAVAPASDTDTRVATLPPARPRFDPPTVHAVHRGRNAAAGRPLDLTSFMKWRGS